MENYRRCCERRMKLWIGPEVETLAGELHSFQVCRGEERLRLVFEPQRCLWTLSVGEQEFQGDFDSLTKRVRRVLTTSLREEEGR